MKKCPLLLEKDLKKQGRGAYDFRVEQESNVVAVRWYDNKPVNLVSSYVSIEPLHTVRRYDRSLKKKIDVKQPNIVHVYNHYMGGIDKLDMMCALYKPRLRTRRWYIYIWFHTNQIAVGYAWF
ncbi:piggyBac transposable element-derived protein 3-like [Hydra vulgaris]|uniref:piggyBac transposable element-derived protein 3-like n=1 Tax=Hydra vulgaris TaxID=6087 RepID=UPI001F5F4126|nr:piggyBac transposable element-derived protein 3-like [Hydra vulgaris]